MIKQIALKSIINRQAEEAQLDWYNKKMTAY